MLHFLSSLNALWPSINNGEEKNLGPFQELLTIWGQTFSVRTAVLAASCPVVIPG